MSEKLLAIVSRCDGGSLRVYRKLHRGRPYFELSAWSSSSEGERRLFFLNLRRYEIRPLIMALGEAAKSMGLSVSREEGAALDAQR